MASAELDPFSVVAHLEGGPRNTLRVRYDVPARAFVYEQLEGLNVRPTQTAQVDPVVEIDRDKLRKLQFSRDELAEIGFALVTRLRAVEKLRAIHT